MRLNPVPVALASLSAVLWIAAIASARVGHFRPDTAYVANAGLTGWRLRNEHQGRNGNAGGLTCHNGKPHLEPPDSSLDGFARDENQLHELMHLQQFSPGCDSIMAIWNTVPFYRLELEAQASCYGIEAWPASERGFRKGLAVRRISLTYGNVVGFEDVYAALDRWCIAGNGPKP